MMYIDSGWHDSSTVAGTIVQQSLNDWSAVTGMILQQWLAWFFNSHWHDSSTATGTILQQSLAWFFNSHWHDSLTVTGMIAQQALAWLFNRHWHDCSTVTGTILQQSRARFFSVLIEFFNSDVHCWRMVPWTRNTTHDSTSIPPENTIKPSIFDDSKGI